MGKHKPQFHLSLNLALSWLLRLTAFESRLEQSVRNTTRRSSPAPTSSPSPIRSRPTSFAFSFNWTHVAEEWNFMHGYIPIWVLYVVTTRCNASLRHYKSRLGKKRCNGPNLYKFLKLRHHTSRILSGREETNTNGGPKWRQISKTLKNHKKIMFCSNRKIFSQKCLFQCVLSDKKRKFFRLWAL